MGTPKTEHLEATKWVKGQPSPNPAGRPPKVRDDIIARKALELLQEPHPKYPEKTRLVVLAERWINRATRGDGFTELIDRIDGPIIAKTEAIVNVNPDAATDEELDGWAKQRARAIADKEAASQAEPSGLCSANEQGPVAVDPPSGPAE